MIEKNKKRFQGSDEISEQLDQSNKRQLEDVNKNSLVQSNTLLLEAPSTDAEDIELLKNFNISHQIDLAEKLKATENKKTHLKHLLNSPTYEGHQIKELCIKYSLKLLPIKYFKGNVPIELPKEINRFIHENNLNSSGTGHQFFVLAPRDHFVDTKRNDVSEELIQNLSKKKGNYLLFYREGDSDVSKAFPENVFNKVTNWGGDTSYPNYRKFLFFTDKGNIRSDWSICENLILYLIFQSLGIIAGLCDFVYFATFLFTLSLMLILNIINKLNFINWNGFK